MQPRAACGSGASAWQRLGQIPSLPGSQSLARREVRRDRPRAPGRGLRGAGWPQVDLALLPSHHPPRASPSPVSAPGCPFPRAAPTGAKAGTQAPNHPSPRGPSPKPPLPWGALTPPGCWGCSAPSPGTGEGMQSPRGQACHHGEAPRVPILPALFTPALALLGLGGMQVGALGS